MGLDKEKARLRQRRYRESHKEELREYARKRPSRMVYQRQYLYGLTPELYQLLVNKQQGLCAICEKPPKSSRGFHIDHNHNTNKVRGLLCAGCNRSIAGFDDKEWLMRAERYLEKNS